MEIWERRIRGANVTMPAWSPRAPERLVYASNESGIWQVWAQDLASGTRRRVSDHPVGVGAGTPSFDGGHVLWFQEETGDESGRWYAQPFPGGDAKPFFEGIPHGWNEGLALGADIAAIAISDREGFHVYLSEGGAPARKIHEHVESVGVAGGRREGGFNDAGLSADGRLLCLEHSEHGDLIHQALRVIDVRSGGAVGDLRDEGMNLEAACWSPIPGDQRLVITHERGGEERPAIWNLETDERTDVEIALDGPVVASDWWPDASALLLANFFEGRDRVFRYDLGSGELTQVAHPQGYCSGSGVRPDGAVWMRYSNGANQALVVDQTGAVIVEPEGDRAPDGRPFVSWHFENEHGQRVHGFHLEPEGQGPFPLIMLVHGGPTWYDADRFYPEAQAYVDAGFAVGLVNYRGSSGYGAAWRDELIGNIGGPELEDVNAGMDDLVARGIADPRRAVIAGWSWGGYTTLMEVGKHPDRWVCAVAGVPVGDCEQAYEQESPLLQAYDRSLLGGEPKELPDLMRERNPINFADRVSVPVLFLIGEHDSRCPYEQAMAYVEKLAARNHPHELYRYSTGHSSLDMDEEVRQQKVVLDFLARNVPA